MKKLRQLSIVDTALALYLSELFGTSPELWLNRQMQWEIWHCLHGTEVKKLEMIQPIVASSNFKPEFVG